LEILKKFFLAILITGAACTTAPASKTPIVFVHGNGGNSAQWRAQVAYFQKQGRPAMAIDLVPPPDGNLSLAAMAGSIDRAVPWKRFFIAGHSYGGAVVATYVAAHPEKIAGVIYVDSAAGKLPLTDKQKETIATRIRADKMRFVHAWFEPMLKPSSSTVKEEVYSSVERTPTEAFIGAFMSLTVFDAKALIDAYRGPRLAIVASDLETPASFQNQFPEIETVRVSGAGHWVMLDKPDEVNVAIDTFLRKAELRH